MNLFNRIKTYVSKIKIYPLNNSNVILDESKHELSTRGMLPEGLDYDSSILYSCFKCKTKEVQYLGCDIRDILGSNQFCNTWKCNNCKNIITRTYYR